mmetsp:Transcript_4510/g.15855  ORF Transcript_4510/g.15855 Transcript_4510/m.15855 type:complete len:243 (-) Transcript_4510:13-741(-)
MVGPGMAQGSSLAVVEDEYDPFRPNTLEQYRRELQKRAANALQQQHDKDTLLALARKAAAAPAADDDVVMAEGHDDDVQMAEGEQEPSGDKGNFAERIMKKMGWKDGQGLGKDGSGMVEPLMAKHIGAGAGKVVDPAAEANEAKTAQSSPVILLENMVANMAEADVSLQQEVREECERIGGPVEQILVTADMRNNARIFVVFKEVAHARAVRDNFDGRFFAQRQVSARQYSAQQFARRQYIL